MKSHELDCYGKFNSRPSKCNACVYSESCRWYTSADDPERTNRHIISASAGGNAVDHAAAAYRSSVERGLPNTPVTMRDLASFARYLLLLDDLTLGIIQEALSGKDTVREIAISAGVSRQAVHRKMLDDIAKRPELSVLYISLMPKLKAARRRLLRKKIERKDA